MFHGYTNINNIEVLYDCENINTSKEKTSIIT